MRTTALAAVLLMGCLTYDFEPVTPLAISQTVKKGNIAAKPPKPALFLVVDKSGSMLTEVSPGVSRMSAMKSAMGAFLTQSGGSAHLGMLSFPAATGPTTLCTGGDIANVDVPLDLGDEDATRLSQVALQVKGAIDGLTANGGTPTAATIHALASYTPLLAAKERDRIAVLLTDGLPNCNSANDAIATTCTCTLATTPPPGQPCSVPAGGVTHNQCLDDQGSSDEIAQLNVRGVRTTVIGFGTDVANGPGAATMAKMATAGGFTRPCGSNADCNAGDTCNAGGIDPCGRAASVCGQSFFQAGNAAELGSVLDAIQKAATCPPCLQVLTTQVTDPRLISVTIDGVPTPRGPDTWQYNDSTTAPTVEFVGALCERVKMSTTAAPVTFEIRTVESL